MKVKVFANSNFNDIEGDLNSFITSTIQHGGKIIDIKWSIAAGMFSALVQYTPA